MAIKYIEKFPTADEFNSLTEAVGWGTRDENVVEEAFKHSLYAISAYDDDKFIGFVSRPNDDLGPGMVLYKKD